jgi:alanine racemase
MTTPGTDPVQARLTVDLAAVVANWRGLAARLAPKAACGGVVKADAYGLGAAQVAPALQAAGCRDFFVAQAGEALALRPVLSASRLFVLHGCLPAETEALAQAGIVPVLNDPGQIETWANQAARLGRHLPAALQVDTGMARLGLTSADAARIAADPTMLAGISPVLVMSHLACAEEDTAMNAAQLRAFGDWRAAWAGLPASLANSSGIFLGPAYHFDLARPGAALYGINPVPGRPNPQRAVVSLSAPVLQIRDIAPPASVGYGATFRAPGKMRVATIAMGYADGWPRSLSGTGTVGFNGKTLPIIGRVSMDLVTLDATAAPDLRPGLHVDLLDTQHDVDRVAAEAGTIGYEILTRLGRRFARSYLPA